MFKECKILNKQKKQQIFALVLNTNDPYCPPIVHPWIQIPIVPMAEDDFWNNFFPQHFMFVGLLFYIPEQDETQVGFQPWAAAEIWK